MSIVGPCSIKFSDLLREKMDWVTGPNSNEVLRDEQILKLHVSDLDLPEPVLLGLSVSCCLDKLPAGAAAAPGAGSEGTGSLHTCVAGQSKQ